MSLEPVEPCAGAGESGFETWSAAIHAICGNFNSECDDRRIFSGWAAQRRIGGFDALYAGMTLDRVRRTARDVRLDDKDYFFLIALLSGRAAKEQGGRNVLLRPGEMTLIDSTSPCLFHYFGEPATVLSIHLPRNQLITHLGFVPAGALAASGDELAKQVLSTLLARAVAEPSPTDRQSDSFYFDCAMLDLVGACFAADQKFGPSQTTQSNLLFARVCDIVRRRFKDPGLSARGVAEEAGISPRYLQKLFAGRETSCMHFIASCRLDHAEHLLRRRKALETRLSIGEIAQLSGFRDVAHFSRAFRGRFGCAPSAF